MKITKSQLQKVIIEALDEEMEDRISGKEMLAMYDAEKGLDVMSAEEAMDELEQILKGFELQNLPKFGQARLGPSSLTKF